MISGCLVDLQILNSGFPIGGIPILQKTPMNINRGLGRRGRGGGRGPAGKQSSGRSPSHRVGRARTSD